MKRLRAIALASLLVAGAAVTAVAAAPAQAAPVICEKFGSTSIQSGRYVVMNNVWGADTAQCIDVNQNGGFTITQAAHNKATNGAPASYPGIYLGCHYTNCSTNSNLPRQVSQIGSANTSIGVSYPSSGTYNAAYDIWLDPTPRTDGQNGAELMIWLNRQGSIQPIGSPVGTANIAGRNWEVWYGNPGWHVISYVSSSPITSLSFNAMQFINNVISRGYINNSWYLTSIQAGFEPWIGGAGLAVTSFSGTVTTGNNPPPPPPPPPPPGPPPPPPPGPPPPPPPGPGGCSVSATVQTQWGGGYVVQPVNVTAGGSGTSGWTVTFTLPAGHTMVNGWNATFTTSGQTVTARNMGYNGNLGPGGTTNFGFQVNRPSGSAVASGYTCSAS